MTALAGDKGNRTAVGGIYMPVPYYLVDSGATIYQGSMVGRDPDDSSNVKALAAASPMFLPLGVSSTKVVGNGTFKAENVKAGLYELENSSAGDAIAATLPLGWPCYAADDNTLALTWSGGTRAKAGVFGGMSSYGKPMIWIGMDPYGLREVVIPLVKGHADLTDADTTQSFNLYTLPGPCRVIGPPVVDSLTLFSGGGTAAATVAIGIDTGSDVDAIGDELDIFTGAAAAPKTFVAGVLGFPSAPIAAGVVITATFVTDTTLAAFTAGAIVAAVRLRPGN